MLDLGPLAIDRQRVRLGRRDLGLHARHVELGDVAGLLAALRQAQRVAVGLDLLAHQHALGIEGTQREVGLRHLGLHRQPRALQQRLAAGRVEPRRVAGAREAPEQVELVREGGAGIGHGGRRGAGRGLVEPGAAVGAGAQAHLRQPVCVDAARDGAGLGQPRRRALDVVVADLGLGDELVQDRIVEGLPPGTARGALGRHGAGPAGGRRGALLLELGRGRGLGQARGHARAAGQGQGRHQGQHGRAQRRREG